MNTMVQIRTVMKEHNRFPPKGFIVFSYSINLSWDLVDPIC